MAFTGVISGLRSVGAGLAANQKPDIDSVLRLIKPYQTPLMQKYYFGGRQSKVVKNKSGKFTWFEDEHMPHQTTVIGALSESSGLTFTASHAANIDYFKLNDLIYIEATDQMAYVSAIVAGTSFTLLHIDGSTPLTSLVAGNIGTYLKKIGSVNSENNSTPTALSTKEVEKYNYLTIFTESVASTGRDQAGDTWTDGTTHDEQVMKKMEEMKLQYERLMMLSISAGLKTVSNIQTTYGKGLKGFYTSNPQSYSGHLDEDLLDQFLAQKIFAKGSTKRDVYVGSDLFMDLQKIVKNKMGSFPPLHTTSYGVRYFDYVHGMGDLKIKRAPVLDGKFANWGFFVEPDQIIPRHMANDKKGSRKFRIESGVETPGTDRTETKLLADIGLEVHNEELGGILYQ